MRQIFMVLIGMLGGPSASADCACQCVEGAARTVCSSLEEARKNPNRCGVGPTQVNCPLPPPPTEAPIQYAPPDGASACRSARLWDPHSTAYSVHAKLCESTAAQP